MAPIIIQPKGRGFGKKQLAEVIRESQQRALQQLLERKTEPTMRNLDGFYELIKEQENR